MAGIIPQLFIDDVLNQTDIVELIDTYVPLKKTGTNYVCCCPFHQEKTPSFNVIPHKQFFYCFGCGASGNAIKFLMLHQHLSFPDGVKQLAQTLGLSLPEESTEHLTSSEMQLLLADIQKLYRNQLLQKPPKVIEYLKSRQLSASMIENFQLGYASPEWHALENKFPHQVKILLESGMIIQKDNKQLYDRFRDRLMFPLQNRQGKLIGFAGRVLEAEQKPKYMNSPETPLFHKQKELYGLYQVLENNKNPDFILVVEGYLDVISLFQYQLPYAVATMGTATSNYHLHILNKYTDHIIFCFDGDLAGQQAAWRALENALPLYNLLGKVSFLFLPENHDPDSYIRTYGQDDFKKLLAQSKSLHAYFCEEMLRLHGKQGTQRLIQELQKYLEKLEDGPGMALIIDEIARSARMDPFRIRQWLQSPPKQTVPHALNKQSITPLRLSISLLLQHPQLLQKLNKEDIPESLPEPLNLVIDTLLASPDLNSAVLVERFNQTPFYEAFNQLMHLEHHIQSERLTPTLLEIFQFLSKQTLNEQIDELLLKLKREGLNDIQKKQLQTLLQMRHTQKI